MDSVFGGTPHYNAKSITTSGGTYNLTTDGNPRKENYNTDAKPGASTPYYEASGANNRTEDSTTIYDLPSNAKSYVEEEFDSGKSNRRVIFASSLENAHNLAPDFVEDMRQSYSKRIFTVMAF